MWWQAVTSVLIDAGQSRASEHDVQQTRGVVVPSPGHDGAGDLCRRRGGGGVAAAAAAVRDGLNRCAKKVFSRKTEYYI